jgi:hypothetical protein
MAGEAGAAEAEAEGAAAEAEAEELIVPDDVAPVGRAVAAGASAARSSSP